MAPHVEFMNRYRYGRNVTLNYRISDGRVTRRVSVVLFEPVIGSLLGYEVRVSRLWNDETLALIVEGETYLHAKFITKMVLDASTALPRYLLDLHDLTLSVLLS